MNFTKNVENLKETVCCYEYTCLGKLNPRIFWDFHVYTRIPECFSYVLIIIMIYFQNSKNWLGFFQIIIHFDCTVWKLFPEIYTKSHCIIYFILYTAKFVLKIYDIGTPRLGINNRYNNTIWEVDHICCARFRA